MRVPPGAAPTVWTRAAEVVFEGVGYGIISLFRLPTLLSVCCLGGLLVGLVIFGDLRRWLRVAEVSAGGDYPEHKFSEAGEAGSRVRGD